MQYRKDKDGNDVSILGYGCMRFTRKAAGYDMDKAEAEIMAAIDAGINYFDTAWLYPGNEVALGTILENNGVRDRVNIATKLPQYMVRKQTDFDKYFTAQLKRLRTDHIDFYLMHMLPDASRWRQLEAIGADDWVRSRKADGSIRNIGFSFHGNSDVFDELLDAYPWDFCMMQYNYLDENSQGGAVGLKAAAARGIPVFIIEPLRGGKLATKLPADALAAFEASGRDWSPAQWSFRWLWNQPEVCCVLSGMNSLEMLRENVATAEDARVGDFTPEDFGTIAVAKAAITSNTKVGCTECRYCMPCPHGVDIPGVFSAYNTMYVDGKNAGRMEYIQNIGARENPGFARKCVACGACETHCPQHLSIIDLLAQAEEALSPLPYRVVQGVAGRFLRR